MLFQEEYKLEEVDPVLSDEELKKVVEPILLEYLENGNSDEVQVSCLWLRMSTY